LSLVSEAAAKYAGNGARDSVTRMCAQTIGRGGFGRGFVSAAPHWGGSNDLAPKRPRACRDRACL